MIKQTTTVRGQTLKRHKAQSRRSPFHPTPGEPVRDRASRDQAGADLILPKGYVRGMSYPPDLSCDMPRDMPPSAKAKCVPSQVDGRPHVAHAMF